MKLTEWNVFGHGQANLRSKRRGLGEKVQVSEREGKSNSLAHVNNDSLVLLVNIGALSELDVAVAEIALGRESHALFGAADDNRVAEDAQVAADARELARRHLDHARVLRIRDTKVLLVQVHQFHLELAHAVLLWRLEDECHVVGFVVSADCDYIVV